MAFETFPIVSISTSFLNATKYDPAYNTFMQFIS